MMTKSFGRVHTFPVSGKRRTAPLRAGYIPLAHIDGRGTHLLWPRRGQRPVLFTSPDAPCGQSSPSPVGRVHTFPVAGKRRTAPLRAGYIPLALSDGSGTGYSGLGAGHVQFCLPLLTRRAARAACPQTTAFHSSAWRLALDALATHDD